MERWKDEEGGMMYLAYRFLTSHKKAPEVHHKALLVQPLTIINTKVVIDYTRSSSAAATFLSLRHVLTFCAPLLNRSVSKARTA